MFIDFTTIVKYAWMAYDTSRAIKSITDISAMVSTNHVYKVLLQNNTFVIAKISYFGRYEYFVEDHTIINVLANNLPSPFENFLARSLIGGKELFVHRFQNKLVDAWVVFYKPIKISKRLPKRFNDEQINVLGKQFAIFHKTCTGHPKYPSCILQNPANRHSRPFVFDTVRRIRTPQLQGFDWKTL